MLTLLKNHGYLSTMVKSYTKKVGVCFTRVHSRYLGSYPAQPYIIDQHWHIHKVNQIGDENLKLGVKHQTKFILWMNLGELMGCSI
jgi:hypothetical protein